MTYDLNPWVSKKEFIDLLNHEVYKKQSISDYIIQRDKKWRDQKVPLVLPGKSMVVSQKFKLNMYDLPVETLEKYQTRIREDIDFAKPIYEEILQNNNARVNLRDFISKIIWAKRMYYNEKELDSHPNELSKYGIIVHREVDIENLKDVYKAQRHV